MGIIYILALIHHTQFMLLIYCRTDQFIFIKERDELVWNDLVESLQEAADLGTNGLSHSPLSHKLNVLTLEIIIILYQHTYYYAY